MTPKLIELQENNFDIVKEIYDYYIFNSTATFFTDVLSVEELKKNIATHHPKYKSYLIRYDNDICGFCYLSQYKNRQAYDRTAEFTVYLKPEFTGKGIGSFVMNEIECIAREAGFKVLMGVITAENKDSVALCEKFGYEKCAHFKQVGEKFGKVLDVVAYQKILED